MAFYLKYRPQQIKDLDLVNVRETLVNIIKSKTLSHAFLFAGPKGTGKTSAARILAKSVNCLKPSSDGEPCNKCDQCVSITNGSNIDCIEIDAASHRGIDDIRALRDAVKLAPASSKKKVYIIDEAHMLTTEASNALLKTLEEPPDHVIFILATTNPEKLIPTIRSRTTLISFKKATVEEIVTSLVKKIKGEGIKVEKGVLEEIAKVADGSFRDADKILEQLSSGEKELKIKKVNNYLIASQDFDVNKLFKLLKDGDAKEAITLINNVVNGGSDVVFMVDKILEEVRLQLLSYVGIGENTHQVAFEKEDLVKLARIFTSVKKDIPFSYVDQMPLELAIVEWCNRSENKTGEGENTIHKKTPQLDGATNKKYKETNNKEAIVSGGSKLSKETNGTNGEIAKGILGRGLNGNGKQSGSVDAECKEVSNEAWKNILSQIRPQNASTEALLRAARPLSFDGKRLKLGVYYKFHKEHLESLNHRKLLEDVCSEVFGSTVSVDCALSQPLPDIEKKEIQTVAQKIAYQPQGIGSNGGQKEQNSVLTDGEDNDIMKIAEEIFSE